MADDGMLMNFASDENLLKVRPVFRGGRWKDRLHAKKSLQYGSRISADSKLSGSNAVPTKPRPAILEDRSQEPPVKKQKISTNASANRPQASPAASSHEIVSSLFTSNPVSKPKFIEDEQRAEHNPTPSNAPLPATLHNFTSLGLSQTLATHLLQNLSLSAPTAIQKAAIKQLLGEDSDAFIQAETGSGKTLAYLLPIIQRLLGLTTADRTAIDRHSGLFALILAPTRELTHQISTVLSKLLKRLPHIVAGSVTGGATKNHEKARLRKGLNILVATPGRLADHLENTEALDVGRVKWLVLDEGDRLMEMGFEEEIKKIVEALDGRKLQKFARVEGKTGGYEGQKRSTAYAINGLPEQRTTVLCSATMKMGVQRLGEISLKDAVHIKAEDIRGDDLPNAANGDLIVGPDVSGQATEAKIANNAIANDTTETAFLAPAQLKQSYIIVPAKQRLVTLAGLLKRTFARKGSVMKAIVFLSCADSVDFHFAVFGRQLSDEKPVADITNSIAKHGKHEENRPSKGKSGSEAKPADTDNASQMSKQKPPKASLPTVAPAPSLTSPANPDLTLHKLHGSLTQSLRSSTLRSFSSTPNPSILLCTDVASRGLDLPNIDLVIEFDPPFSSEEHLHRIGRTARAGKEGRAICFLMPGSEEGYIAILKVASGGGGTVKGENAEDVLRKGFAPGSAISSSATAAKTPPTNSNSQSTQNPNNNLSSKWDTQATTYQLDVERLIIADEHLASLARKAFTSHVRAYATHVAKERNMFDVKDLHLGHLAKGFALRERPGRMGRAGGNDQTRRKVGSASGVRAEKGPARKEGSGADAGAQARGEGDAGDAAARKMRNKMREQMMNGGSGGGAGEFNIG